VSVDALAVVRRVERTAAFVALALVVITLVVWRGRTDVAAGVVGGWVLVAASAWLTRSSVDGLLALGRAAGTGAAGNRPYLAMAMRFIGRYALLAAGAYVMIARLRLSPIGVLLGASSIAVAASIEVARSVGGSRVR
jgi:hypothetical protein